MKSRAKGDVSTWQMLLGVWVRWTGYDDDATMKTVKSFKQALHQGISRKVTREWHAKEDVGARRGERKWELIRFLLAARNGEVATLRRRVCFNMSRHMFLQSAFPWNLAFNSLYTLENPDLLVCGLNSLPIDKSFSSVLQGKVSFSLVVSNGKWSAATKALHFNFNF